MTALFARTGGPPPRASGADAVQTQTIAASANAGRRLRRRRVGIEENETTGREICDGAALACS
jgi:hypothetical protein